MNRIGRFVRAARSLLLVQLAAALIAVALSVWAVFAVRDLATERDQLRERVVALESERLATPTTATATRAGVPQSPLDTEVRPPAILPMAIPVPAALPETNEIAPTDPVPEVTNQAGETGSAAAPEQDCTGENAALPRCQRRRWTRGDPVLRRPDQQVRPNTEQPAPTPR